MSDPGRGLQAYIVGGAVRDDLLGLPPGDRDWVVVGATPEEMARRGFIPVGGDFPVFLHPRTKEEYALARTERKSGRGYKGFTFYTGRDVTLEEDLCRRDLTVNAMARTPDGAFVDPLGGRADLEARVLRHVGAAFSEDPVRLLRLARFAARFPDFSIAPETLALSRRLVEEGEVDALVPERIWLELAKGLATSDPVRMFDVLQCTGALARIAPDLVITPSTGPELACASERGLPLASRYALLCRASPDHEAVSTRFKAPRDCRDQARLLPLVLDTLGRYPDTDAPASLMLDLFERCDALRKPGRFTELLQACGCVRDIDPAPWQAGLRQVRAIDAGAIARSAGPDPERIKPALRQARLAALSDAIRAPLS